MSNVTKRHVGRGFSSLSRCHQPFYQGDEGVNDDLQLHLKWNVSAGRTDVRFCLQAVIEMHGVANPVVSASSHGADIKSSLEDTDIKPVPPERSVGCQCESIGDLTWMSASVMDTPYFRSYAATGRDSHPRNHLGVLHHKQGLRAGPTKNGQVWRCLRAASFV